MRITGAVAKRIENMPWASGFGPAGKKTIMAKVTCRMVLGHLCKHVTSTKVKK